MLVNATKEELYHNRDASDKVNPGKVDLKKLAKEVRVATSSSHGATLVVLDGPDCGATFRAGRRRCLVGRDPACHLMLRDESVSRFHDNFKQDSDGMMNVQDLDSMNGTFIDGKRVTNARLKKGDKIEANIYYRKHGVVLLLDWKKK